MISSFAVALFGQSQPPLHAWQSVAFALPVAVAYVPAGQGVATMEASGQ